MLLNKAIRWMVCAIVIAGAVAPLANAEPVDGPQSGVFWVPPYSSNVHYIDFRGGELASIAVVGDGGTDLDLFVYDEYGNLVASNNESMGTCSADWYPRYTSTFRIEVVNRGPVYIEYQLAAW
jgi:hypothetical protein